MHADSRHDSLHKTEHLRQQIVEQVYTAFLTEANRLPELEWRMAAIECAMRLLRGVECSTALDADLFAPANVIASPAVASQSEAS
jgi:hypothetical protein